MTASRLLEIAHVFVRLDHVASRITNGDDAFVTIIEIRPFRNGWKCFEAPGVEPAVQIFGIDKEATAAVQWQRKSESQN